MTIHNRDRLLSDDVLWGVASIAAYIRRPLRKTYRLIELGLIPVHHLGHRTIYGLRSELDAHFRAHPDASPPDAPTAVAPESERERKPLSPRGRR